MLENKEKFFYFSTGIHAFRELLNPINGWETFNLKSANVVIFDHNDSDISPEIYGDTKTGKYTKCNKVADTLYAQNYIYARDKNIKIIGINRGAHFIAAKAGAEIIQDVTNHGCKTTNMVYHNIVDKKGMVYWVNSCHHQMINPFSLKKEEYDILAIASPRLSSRYLNQLDNETTFINISINNGYIDNTEFKESEIIIFPKINALAIQPNPEKMLDGSSGVGYIRSVIKDFIYDKK